MSMPSLAFLSPTFRVAWLRRGALKEHHGISGRPQKKLATLPKIGHSPIVLLKPPSHSYNYHLHVSSRRFSPLPQPAWPPRGGSPQSRLWPPSCAARPRKLLPRLGGVHLAGLRLHLCGATLWRPGLGRGWRHLRPKGACSWAVGSEWEVRTTTDGAWCNCRGISFGMFWVLLLGGVL